MQARIRFGGEPDTGAVGRGVVDHDQMIQRLCQKALQGTAQLVEAVVRNNQGRDTGKAGLRQKRARRGGGLHRYRAEISHDGQSTDLAKAGIGWP